ncbi:MULTISPECIES: MaoC family dehydratase [Pandoraea]|uniref:Acyl dehydratase n=2 Tax=Pandoraea TaxID=93217 RepID=A0A378YQL1_9BURK|nr:MULTISPECIES: MaoC family dehydratase [Pandoraea]AHN75532.1 acyl dehydratase [Pandoraea pnomenusa]AIM44020.1 acyl dehydratase [Pandoraea pnomenusa 3kgm]AIU27898.1 acyl dehydratase [Pandoraea pnomenusa]ANC45016.1 acyl dehydratase [Pandoraea pnomenusa]APD11648.1 acyl dehydratase [Pandoraea pnomenusa]
MGKIVAVGETFSATHHFSPDSIREFSTLACDLNPLHHDADYAAADPRFGGLISSGTQQMSYLAALLATHYSRTAQPLGLEFDMKLRRAVHAGDDVTVRWTVTDSLWKEKLAGDIVSLEGEAVNQRGETVIAATAKILVSARPT